MFTPTIYSASGLMPVTPVLILADVEAASHFYQEAFAFTKKQVLVDAKGRVACADMSWPSGSILLVSIEFAAKHTDKALAPPVLSIVRLICDQVDELFAHAVKAGATALSAPKNFFWGERSCILADPYGNRWVFANMGGEYRHPDEGV